MTEKQLHALQDINILSTNSLTAPADLKKEFSLNTDVAESVYQSREAVKAILRGDDRRVIAVVGPCSTSVVGRRSTLVVGRQSFVSRRSSVSAVVALSLHLVS